LKCCVDRECGKLIWDILREVSDDIGLQGILQMQPIKAFLQLLNPLDHDVFRLAGLNTQSPVPTQAPQTDLQQTQSWSARPSNKVRLVCTQHYAVHVLAAEHGKVLTERYIKADMRRHKAIGNRHADQLTYLAMTVLTCTLVRMSAGLWCCL